MSHHSKVKCIATLGPKSFDPKIMRAMAEAGATMFRTNFAHMQRTHYIEVKRIVDELKADGHDVQLQADLQGYRVRVGVLPGHGLHLIEQRIYHLVPEGQASSAHDIPIDIPDLNEFVKVGQALSFANGLVEAEITRIDGERITIKTINSGQIQSHKSINLPESHLQTGITDKDRSDIEFLIETGVDWIAASFVANRQDIEGIRALLGHAPVKIMGKIERRQAIANLEEIVEACDAIMVARGDLGIELPYEQIPLIQRNIIHLSHKHHTPAVVATQMLYSLVHSTHPTRAEVSDVAFALGMHADGVLLSDETSIGIDPVGAVKVLRRILDYNEPLEDAHQNYFDL